LKLLVTATVIAIFVMVVAGSLMLPVKASSETDNIGIANLSINQAFANVLAAEAAGGNVTGLLAKLNGAGELLAEAERGYQNGNLAGINDKANSAILIANQVKSDAATLTISSRNNSENNFLLTATFSIVGIAFLLFALNLIWRRAKRGYYKKLLGSKPEVVNNQA
jgi:hypothetical protein